LAAPSSDCESGVAAHSTRRCPGVESALTRDTDKRLAFRYNSCEYVQMAKCAGRATEPTHRDDLSMARVAEREAASLCLSWRVVRAFRPVTAIPPPLCGLAGPNVTVILREGWRRVSPRRRPGATGWQRWLPRAAMGESTVAVSTGSVRLRTEGWDNQLIVATVSAREWKAVIRGPAYAGVEGVCPTASFGTRPPAIMRAAVDFDAPHGAAARTVIFTDTGGGNRRSVDR